MIKKSLAKRPLSGKVSPCHYSTLEIVRPARVKKKASQPTESTWPQPPSLASTCATLQVLAVVGLASTPQGVGR